MNIFSKFFLLLFVFFLFNNFYATAEAKTTESNYQSIIEKESLIIKSSSKTKKIASFIRRGEVYRVTGYLNKAQSDFEKAILMAKNDKKQLLGIVATQSLGDVFFQKQKYTKAKELLLMAQKQAKNLQNPHLMAVIENSLGTIYEAEKFHNRARNSYLTALKLTQGLNDIGLVVAIKLNLSSLSDKSREKYLKEAYKIVHRVPNKIEREKLLLSIAQKSRLLVPNKSNLNFTYQAFIDVLNITDTPRLRSLANGELGSLYESQNSISKALIMTQRAILDAQYINSDNLLLKWQWQLGRLLHVQGDTSRAIAAYRRTIYHLNIVRKDIPITYKDGRSSFKETLSPIYYGLADLLLKQVDTQTDERKREALLSEARDTIEKIKLSEMQDYFQDKCMKKEVKKIESLSKYTAVLYPIIFKDRLELLVAIGSKLYRRKAVVSQKDLQKSTHALVKSLRPQYDGTLTTFNKKEARNLYGWIIKPLSKLLKKSKIDTLVFIPDGVLRLFPIASLWDGKNFLVQNYAIATAPGLTLLDPKPLKKYNMQTLLAGMSKPGPVVNELSDNMRYSLASSPLAQNRGLRSLPIHVRALKISKAKIKKLKSDKQINQEVKERLALPGVKEEITKLSNILDGQIMFNDAFLLKQFSSSVIKEPYQIIHIASHGFFGGTSNQSFIMTYDHKLDMNHLSSILKAKQFSKYPIELLTLSACQTAEGDDRSPLGLSGVALRSGVRSVLGSLWPVSDEAATLMLPLFYKNLMKPNTTKAKALQAAQIKLIQTKKLNHPFYWSPFILIGNWL
jgi:CHAT domain-containing protein